MVGATQVTLHTASWREAPGSQCLLYLVTVPSSIGWDNSRFSFVGVSFPSKKKEANCRGSYLIKRLSPNLFMPCFKEKSTNLVGKNDS